MLQTTTATTGHTLRRARELAGLRERTAARSLGIRRSRLRDWESGDVLPDADEVARAVDLYSADLNRIWPDRTPLVARDEPGVLVVGDERIDVREQVRLTPEGVMNVDNRVVLTQYLAAVRRQRGQGSDEPVELRAADIASLATVLDLDDAALEAELADLLDLTPAGARWTARAMVVGALMAVGTSAALGSSWFSPAAASTAPSAPAGEAQAASIVFAPEHIDPAAPVDAEVVTTGPEAPPSPFSTEPTTTRVELAPAVFAIAPSTEWSPVDDSAAPFSIEALAAELPASDGPG